VVAVNFFCAIFSIVAKSENELQTSQRVFFLENFAINVREIKKDKFATFRPCDPTCFKTIA
jgi:hypothetical protein